MREARLQREEQARLDEIKKREADKDRKRLEKERMEQDQRLKKQLMDMDAIEKATLGARDKRKLVQQFEAKQAQKDLKI